MSAYSARPWPRSSRGIALQAMGPVLVMSSPGGRRMNDDRRPARSAPKYTEPTRIPTPSALNSGPGIGRSPSTREGLLSWSGRWSRLDRVADVAQDRADLAAQEEQGNDRDDRDQGQDEGVLGEALAVFGRRQSRDHVSNHSTPVPSDWTSRLPQEERSRQLDGG